MKKGFTLVELSIVLVIIGLLIGGILVAQSMINTAKIQSQVRQLGSFDAAIANFQTKYNGLPGDTIAISGLGGACGGSDGDGYISSPSSCTTGIPSSVAYTGEIVHFWHDLSISGLSTDGVGSGNTPPYSYAPLAIAIPMLTVNSATANAPSTKVGAANSGLIVTAIAAGGGTGNYYVILNAAQSLVGGWAQENTGTAALNAVDAAALDAKLDDGVGSAGNIVSVKFGNLANISAPSGVNATGCIGTGAYDVTKITYDCDIAIRVGINTGNLQ